MAAALTRRAFSTAATLIFKSLDATLPPPSKTPISPAFKKLIITPPTRLLSITTSFTFHPISPLEDDHSASDSENLGVFSKLPKQTSIRCEHPFLKSGNPNLFQLKSDDESARPRLEMPGIDKSGLKVWFENGVLKIEGKAKEKEDGRAEKEGKMREYDVTVEFLEEAEILKKEKAVAEMKNGVLWIAIPKIKVEERKNVVNVKVA